MKNPVAENRVGESSPISSQWLDDIKLRAELNLKKWGVQSPQDIGLAIAEETGEIAQAILKAYNEGASLCRIADEAVDLAALTLQMLVTLIQVSGVTHKKPESK
jgi:NTP pyrophosphatase (non-canonical NTP hydrolase)